MNDKILIGRKAICVYLQISKNLFYKLVRAGMPANNATGCWVSYTDHLDQFFREISRPADRLKTPR